MNLDPRTPVLVGAAAVEQRCDDPLDALESFQLMAAAAERAAEDAGCTELLAAADSIRVPRGFWAYSDPGRLIAKRVGAKAVRTEVGEIGVLQQTLIGEACRDIAAGEADVVLVAGGDTRFRSLRAKICEMDVHDVVQLGVEPHRSLRPHGSLWADVEERSGLIMPVGYYTVMESALRHHQGLSLDAHRDEVAQLWAAFNRVAHDNPHAWDRELVSAGEIRNPSPKNPMLAFPYTKLLNSQWNVDQAAGLILCSAEKATALGISSDRWIHPWASTESNCLIPVSARAELHRCPGVAIAGGRALEVAGLGPDDVKYLDLYSCFPSAVRIQARELGFGFDRPLTVTGGMTFAGGPLNNYVLQSTVRMVERLREDPDACGLVTAISGMITKQGFALWSGRPAPQGFHFQDLTAEVAQGTELKELADEHAGRATVAGYTVLYMGELPIRAIAVCDLADGRRTVAASDDHELAAAMTQEEFCGREMLLEEGGLLRGLASAG